MTTKTTSESTFAGEVIKNATIHTYTHQIFKNNPSEIHLGTSVGETTLTKTDPGTTTAAGYDICVVEFPRYLSNAKYSEDHRKVLQELKNNGDHVYKTTCVPKKLKSRLKNISIQISANIGEINPTRLQADGLYTNEKIGSMYISSGKITVHVNSMRTIIKKNLLMKLKAVDMCLQTETWKLRKLVIGKRMNRSTQVGRNLYDHVARINIMPTKRRLLVKQGIAMYLN
ncbi:uncharacterized protein EV154DRAFT_476830 [Mucor mucedo]|uniref:uncharacterized protein n=1 Tax=Mucor mucedo TaxID=29922 RepID=UPI00221F612E|nr:uncharacterized protein EV154DRAFT_476830 [Mucor mucedo]KAI7896110.1 hypothetical protein EV154DRAFT_476830 [Mucor mucedo]